VYWNREPLSSQLAVSAMLVYVLLLSILMVSRLPYLSIKKLKLTQGNPAWNLVALSIFVALIWKYSQIVLFVLATSYALSGFLFYLPRKYWPSIYCWAMRKADGS